MLNIKKAFTVLARIEFWSTLPVSLTLILMFCGLSNLYAQMPGDFPQEMGFDPRHLRESGVSPSAISKDVELVGTTGGAVYDVFVFTSFSSLLS